MTKSLASNIVLDGSTSVADEFTTIYDLTRSIISGTGAAILVKATVTTDVTAITLQMNADVDLSVAQAGWFDMRHIDIRMRQNSGGLSLAQTNSLYTNPVTGIITATGVYLIEFLPVAARYRLKFELVTATDIVIDDVVAAP